MQFFKIKCLNKVSPEQIDQIHRWMDKIEQFSPSDSTVIVEISEKDGKLCGLVKINSLMLRLKVFVSKQVGCNKLLEVLDQQCSRQIEKWKHERKFTQYNYDN